VLIHVGFLYILNSSISHVLVERVFGPIKTEILEEQKVEAKEPPPPPPDIAPPPPDYVPPPDLAIETTVEAPVNAIRVISTEKPPDRPPPPAPKPRTEPKIDAKHQPTRPDYPTEARRKGESGTVVLELYVLENGRVGEAKVKKSSGSESLDNAAVREAKRSWKLIPAMEDGKPVAAWTEVKMTFPLEDA